MEKEIILIKKASIFFNPLYKVLKNNIPTNIILRNNDYCTNNSINYSIGIPIKSLPDYIYIAYPTKVIPGRWNVFKLEKIDEEVIFSYDYKERIIISRRSYTSLQNFSNSINSLEKIKRDHIYSGDSKNSSL